ncbi:MAG: Clp1/GlmU family protein [Promethearchaeota archaeon]
MKVTISSERSLLLSGPGSFSVSKGICHLFGKALNQDDSVLISPGRIIPLEAETKTEIKLDLSGGRFKEVEGKLIPFEWKTLAERMSKQDRFIGIIIGECDSGKTSLILYLTNKLAKSKKVAVIDCDLGQSKIGPPGTIGLGITTDPYSSLEEMSFIDGYFIGSKIPGGNFAAVIAGISRLTKRALQEQSDYILVDTSGYVSGPAAAFLKAQKIMILNPNAIILLENDPLPLKPLIQPFKNVYPVWSVPIPKAITVMSREGRVALREFAFQRYFQNSQKIKLNLNSVSIFDSRQKPASLPSSLVGLYGAQGLFLGCGILLDINNKDNVLTCLTPVNFSLIHLVQIGEIRISPDTGKELLSD